MIKQTLCLDEVIDYLNEIIAIDAQALTALTNTRVHCHEGFAEHPSVQVVDRDGFYSVGFIGIVNGLFGVDEEGYGAIVFVFDDDGILRRVEKTARNYKKG